MIQSLPTASSEGCEKYTILSASKKATISLSVWSFPLILNHEHLADTSCLGFIFGGALFGFILARMQYLSVGGKFKDGTSPSEWYHLRDGHERIGITLHLTTVIPLGFLLVFQVC